MGFFAWLFRKKQKKVVLGIALGSGGAKGFAHLGALKAFEENGVEFDVISGTSIGSIIGAFYANGYSATDIMELIKTVNLSDFTNGFFVNMDTSGIVQTVSQNLGEVDISMLKKPFRPVATEIESGKEKVFDKGDVSLALAASSCMPPFFKPVVIDGQRYVDGAYSNSVPADVVKSLGADFVVGIDLSNSQKSTNPLSKLFPTYQGKVGNPKEQGQKFSDVLLVPDLTEFSALSFRNGQAMFDIGYKTAIEQMPSILQAIEKLKRR